MPHLRDPARGWVATANNRHWPASHVFHGGRAYADGFRAFRIEELLARRSRHDLESQRLAQCDVQAVDARFLLPRLLPLVADAAAPSSTRARALRDLRDWDYAATLDCRACGVYRAWVSELMEMDVDEGALYRLLAAPTPELRERVRSAFARAAERFAGRRWGEIHGNPFTHLSDDPRFRQPPLPTPGDEDSVNPGSGRWRGDRYEQQTGASQRMLVELADPPRIHRILAGPNDTSLGPLDAPGSPWRRWRDCELDRAEFPFDWGAAAGTPSERVSL
jgi:acyl-homoserine lactone acylase PvdQ